MRKTQPKTRRRVQKTSWDNVEAQLQDKTYGESENDKKLWTNEEDDVLLEGFLVYEWCYISERDCFKRVLKRHKKSITTQLWKLFVKYPEAQASKYETVHRTNRTGKPFTLRDKAAIAGTFGEGLKKGYIVDPYVHLAKILGRDLSEVHAWIKRTVDHMPHKPTLLVVKPKQESDQERIVRVITQAFQATLDTILNNL